MAYNPSRQTDLCSDAERCIFGNFPTLADLKYYFGDNMPIIWLLPQLLNLSEFCGCKDKLTEGQIEETASLIARDFFYLKVTELMLFFSFFKTGKYGRFYGAIDPLLIISGIRTFIDDFRNKAIDRRETQLRMERQEKEKNGSITYADYLALKEKALNGDTEALKLLTPPDGDPEETHRLLKKNNL